MKATCSQNPKLMLETCAPELINVVTFCPSTMTGTSLDHPTKQAMGSRLRKGTTGVASGMLVYWAVCRLASLGLGNGNVRCLLLALAALTEGG